MATPDITNIPAPRVPLIDERTGTISREWYRFLLNLFRLTGSGSNNTTLTEIQYLPVTKLDDQQNPAPATLFDVAPVILGTEPALDPAIGIMAETLASLVAASEEAAFAPVVIPVLNPAFDYIDFNSPVSVALKSGRIWWDASGTLNIGMGNGLITQQVGEEFFQYGKASAAISDVNLQLVYKTGVVGASGAITFAPVVAGIVDTDLIIGIATEPLLLNAFGRVTTLGTVRGINTTGSVYGEVWVDNDDIWYNPVTGGLTKVKPVAPNIKQQVGTVINAGSGGSGSFYVKIAGSSILGGTDANVQLGALVSGDSLVYDSALGYWLNKQASALTGAPITKTADFTVAPGETWFINNKAATACVVTLPSAATFIGRAIGIKNLQAFAVNSASSNVVPIDSVTAGTAILLPVVGNWANLISNGTNWVIMQQAPNNILLLE